MKLVIENRLKVTAIAAAVLVLGGCGGGGSNESRNSKPTYLGTVVALNYDGASDDLLTEIGRAHV